MGWGQGWRTAEGITFTHRGEQLKNRKVALNLDKMSPQYARKAPI